MSPGLSPALSRFVLTTAFAALAHPASAETRNLPQIVIYASQVPVEASKVGSAVSVVTGEELRARGVSSVAEALRGVPGVAVGASGGRGALTQVRMRGFEANHTLVLIDGIQMNDINNGDFNFAGLSVDDIERIEVIRGPQSGLFGANAHAGVVSVVTRSGKGLKRPEADIRIEGGSQRSHAASVSARGAAGPVYAAVTVSNESSQGFNVSRFGAEKDGHRATIASARAGIDFSPSFNVEGTVRWTDRANRGDPADYACTFSFVTFTCPPNNPSTYGLPVDGPDRTAFENLAGSVVATATLLEGRYTQQAAVRGYEDNLVFRDATGLANSSTGKRTQIETRGAFRFATPAGDQDARHTLAWGLDQETETFTQFSSFFDAATRNIWGAGFERNRVGVYGEYLIDLPSGLTVSAALRRDDFDTFEDATTWRLTAAQRIAATGTRLHGSVGTGVTKPTFVEQFGFFPNSFRGNPSLRPERSQGWDFGIEQAFWDGRVVLDVTYFEASLADEIRSRSLGGGISTVVNSPVETHRRGVETTLRIDPFPWLSLEASHTHTDARAFDGNFNAVLGAVRRPTNSASGRATVSFADGKGKASVGVTYNGPMTDWYFGVTTSRVNLPEHTVVGAMLSYDVTPQATVYVRGENVFDAAHEQVYGFRAPGAVVYGGLKVKLGQ